MPPRRGKEERPSTMTDRIQNEEEQAKIVEYITAGGSVLSTYFFILIVKKIT